MGTASPPAHIVVVRTCVRVEKVLFNSFVRKYGALSFFCVFGRVGYHAPEREPIPGPLANAPGGLPPGMPWRMPPRTHVYMRRM